MPIERKLKRCAEVKSQENADSQSDKEDNETKDSENSKKNDIIKQMQGISSLDNNGKLKFSARK